MRFVVILLVSFVAHASAEVLRVKCGDETCERPSNRAVTTLRYTPDKPYKLQIYAVNSEVEIFGVTDDLYYIRHGKNYGFLPKNHLREKARGNYPFSVEIDISGKRIDQQVREQNFLHEFLKSSQPDLEKELAVNDTISEPVLPVVANEPVQPAPVNEPNQENVMPDAIAIEKPSEVPLDLVEETKPIATADSQRVERSAEDENDSGIDDDEDDEDDEDDDDEDSEEISNNSASSKEEKPVEPEQPELVAIPPGKDRDLVNEIPKSIEEEKPLALAIPASANEQVPVVDTVAIDTFQNATIDEAPKIEKQIPEFIPLKEESAQEAANLLELKNDSMIISDPVVQQTHEVPTIQEPVVQQTLEVPTIQEPVKVDAVTEKPEEVVQATTEVLEVKVVQNENIEAKPDLVFNNSSQEELEEDQEPIVETVTPSPILEAQNEFKVPAQMNTEAPMVPLVIEKQLQTDQLKSDTFDQSSEEVTTQSNPQPDMILPVMPPVDSLTTATPQVDIPVTSEVPELLEIPQPEVIETTPLPLPRKLEPDALLQRFNQKLGQRSGENTGKGTVEPLHRQDDHHHGHNHDHGHHHDNHDHGHHHHDQKKPEDKPSEIPQETTTEAPSEKSTETEEKVEPGFFGGLFKKFFSDEDDSEQHFHESPKAESVFATKNDKTADSEYCEKIDSENCPQSLKVKRELNYGKIEPEWTGMSDYLKVVLNEAVDHMDLIISMGLTALTCLIFTLGYYAINKARTQGPLIAKMNELERHLMASTKENDMLKSDVMNTKQKLMSIEDNSFGSNDMVIALKQDLEDSEQMRNELSEKVFGLEKELEAAAEDGLELNRMVSELLNNQTGSESIISSVEDLQRQLNEQQETIVTMNETLAAKSRENSELQIQLSEINGKFQGDVESFQQQVDAIVLERTNLQIELENLKRDSDSQVNQLIEERNGEVTRLNSELTSYAKSYEETKKSLNNAEAKVQALDELLKAVKKDSKGTVFKDLFDVADLKADLLAVTKEKSTIQEQLQTDKDSRKLLEDRVKSISEEMSNLKKEFGVAEKEKLEAQTRLEVLSTYFKDKETQLQQELSFKEARWMKQQGETTTTVEKVQALNDEIQTLKSQNDSLRVEIEAQVAAHKLSISSIEAQSHSAWLNARQAERKLDESRMESAALRRRLTSIAENPAGASDLLNGLPGMINDSMNLIPSPIRVESPNNVNGMPPPPMMMPPFLPPGFMPGAPTSFLPPPPFLPPGEMGPPLGRLMSPPPKRFTPTMRDDRNRYSPRGRGRYSPDSRYDDYTAFETETDYSPPPSPSPPRRGYNSPSDRSKKSKGGHSSAGSLESNPTSRRK